MSLIQVPLSCNLLSCTGVDASRYLQGQFSADIRALTQESWQESVLCNHKGALQALVGIRLAPTVEIPKTVELQESPQDHKEYWIDYPRDLEEELFARLDRYLVADEAKLSLLDPQPTILHLVDTKATNSATVAKQIEALLGQLQSEFTAPAVSANRFGIEGIDLVVPTAELTSITTKLTSAGFQLSNEINLAPLRIQHLSPAWNHEIQAGILPPEAGIAEPVYSFYKGCYQGQEILSRLKSVGRARKLLARLNLESGLPPKQGWQLYQTTQNTEKSAGHITTAHADCKHSLAILTCKIADSSKVLYACPPAHTNQAAETRFSTLTIEQTKEPLARTSS